MLRFMSRHCVMTNVGTNNYFRFSALVYSTRSKDAKGTLLLNEKAYPLDHVSNLSERIISKLNAKLHNKKHHPVNLIKRKIQTFFYKNFVNRVGNPLFTMVDDMDPVVTLYQNFDSLLVPKNHVSRSIHDSYYINSQHMLRAHTSAHQEELIKMGFNKFLVSGDVYRRDAIDGSHYPVFHQMEGVCLFTQEELFANQKAAETLKLFEQDGVRCDERQETHTMEAKVLIENHLKNTLLDLTTHLFGKEFEYKWVETYFPFTHPSWELEIMNDGEWLEVLGCGIMEQEILRNAGAGEKVGWAFGLGLDRLAMKLFEIPDIRLLWSEDPRFLKQFEVDNLDTDIKFQAFSSHPPCINDLSFWLPETDFSENDFYDLVRSVGGQTVESVTLVDQFTHPKRQRTSHCYRLVYRHTDRALTQQEVNDIHKDIERCACEELGVEIR